jgi:hypothetical protein
MRWFVVRFRGWDKTPSIIDWERQQRPSHRASEQRAHHCNRVTTTGDGTAGSAHRERQATGSAGVSGPQEGRTARRKRRATGHRAGGASAYCETRAYRGPAGFGGPFVRSAEVEKCLYFPAFPAFSTGRKTARHQVVWSWRPRDLAPSFAQDECKATVANGMVHRGERV